MLCIFIENWYKLFDDIRSKCKLVASFPKMGKSYGRLIPNLRGFVVDDYIIFYYPMEDELVLLVLPVVIEI
ncbi:type II toxin-antitoxin system RelE/ParE family toxin [Nostoc sp. ChiSLP03a]|uniref:type II toxin-antitoxin system RelE/ParE family toxin n=1 Tax=Nostoc sp. ChiSLP03a TaxID=3075380 RepID=UPI00391D4C98